MPPPSETLQAQLNDIRETVHVLHDRVVGLELTIARCPDRQHRREVLTFLYTICERDANAGVGLRPLLDGLNRWLKTRHLSAVGDAVGESMVALMFDQWRSLDITLADHLLAHGGERFSPAGGTTAMYAAALMDDFWLAVPSCSFGRLNDTWFAGRRCVCGYVPGMLQSLDLPDVLALQAPRPTTTRLAGSCGPPSPTCRPAMPHPARRKPAAWSSAPKATGSMPVWPGH